MSTDDRGTSSAAAADEDTALLIAQFKSQLKKLDVQKQALESEAQAIVQELTSPGENGEPPMGIDTPLVDPEGYPRADVDVFRARTLRKRFLEIQTDHKALQRQIQEGLVQVNILQNPHVKSQDKEEKAARLAPKPKPTYDKAKGKWIVRNWDGSIAGQDQRPAPPPTTASVPATASAPLSPDVLVPFAVIDAVAPESPASEAGLCDGDLITRFGPINYTNHRNLSALMDLVPEAAADQQPIEITFLRRRRMSEEQDMAHSVEAGVRVTRKVEIVPRPWGGRGLLGCHIVGYTDEIAEASYQEPTTHH